MPNQLRSIRKFPDLVRYLETELEWPVAEASFDDLTFEYQPAELGLKDEDAVKIKKIHQLRPLASGQPWGIFFIEFEKKKLPVVVLRCILSHLVVKKRQSANKADQAVWNPEDLLFISAFGDEASDQREIAFAHFHQQAGDLPTLNVLGWDGGDTPLKLDYVAGQLKEKLHWPANPKDQNAWRAQWRAPFRHRIGHVIRTADSLAEVLAALARGIRDRCKIKMRAESEHGALTKLYKGFQTALIHDLKPEDFADTYAQTITYGLLTAAISRTEMSEGRHGTVLLAENITDMVPVTNPFLKEMLQTFLKVGGRKGGIDFDELGIQDVVELLRGEETDLPAILRDFGNKTRGEDPVIHFYEHFLSAYNKQLKIQRGVFYTPQPVVSYIVRSVHELLQTEFGLEDGLASTATWGEMIGRAALPRRPDSPSAPQAQTKDGAAEHRSPTGLKLPEGVKPGEMFVQILDPATGTATFLVEVIDVIHRTLKAKWDQGGLAAMPRLPLSSIRNGGEGRGEEARGSGNSTAPLPSPLPARASRGEGASIRTFGEYWNQYVPLALLPRLHGYELMMAPYAIAHMKIGLKLHETGYHFGTEERARIYLTNALEPKVTQLPQIGFDALAHEAAAVNEIKWYKRFTVVIGNPPYANFGMMNKIPFILDLLEDYKRGLDEKKINLDDDFIKFVRFSQALLDQTGVGVLGFITNNVYLDGLTHRRMRQSLMETFPQTWLLDLHGSAKKLETSRESGKEENVFDIQQGVAIGIFMRSPLKMKSVTEHSELWGTRESKYRALDSTSVTATSWHQLNATPPHHFFVPKDFSGGTEYEASPSLADMFSVFQNGLKTDRDDLFFDFCRDELELRIRKFYSKKYDKSFADQFSIHASSSYDIEARRNQTRFSTVRIKQCLYRPFDIRWLYYDPDLTSRPASKVMRHQLAGENAAFICLRQTRRNEAGTFFVSQHLINKDAVSLFDIGTVFPLFLYDETLSFDLGSKETGSAESLNRRPNFSPSFLKTLATTLKLPQKGAHGLPDGVTSEDIFHYAYGVFHSPGYRSRYAEFLKIDFPRLPLTGKLELFRALARLGGELTALHLLESPKLDQPITEFIGRAALPRRQGEGEKAAQQHGPTIEKISFTRSAAVPAAGSRGVPPRVAAGSGTLPKPAGEDACATGTVWLDKAQTTGFSGVREDVWNFHIGGYQVCEKWLKDRKGRTLSAEDRAHYQKIVVALSETIRLMKEIDEVIEKHGGWPMK